MDNDPYYLLGQMAARIDLLQQSLPADSLWAEQCAKIEETRLKLKDAIGALKSRLWAEIDRREDAEAALRQKEQK